MKSLFVAGIFLGLITAVGAARFYPWVDHPRPASRTVVLHNGGRLEDFLIRYPADRITSVGTAEMGLRAKAYPKGVELPVEMASEGVLVEHFKLRDDQGDVIGVAARHTSIIEDEATTIWALTIPSRGTMHLLGVAEPGTLERELATAGWIYGQAWSGGIDLSMGFEQAGSNRIIGGSHEFADLVGTYAENWLISGVSRAGDLRGTITLQTIAQSGE